MKQGSAEWNDELFLKHPTPYTGISGKIEYKRAKRIYRLIKKFGKHKSINTIVEIGCEQGNLLNFLSEKFPKTKLYGTDISKVALERASQSLPNDVVLMENDITQEIPKIKEHDVLICSEVLEHIPDYEKAIENIAKLAKEDTLVIITVPLEKHKNNIKRILLKLGLFDLLFKGIEEGLSEWHVNDFSKKDISDALSKHFEFHHYELLFLLHQMIVLKKK